MFPDWERAGTHAGEEDRQSSPDELDKRVAKLKLESMGTLSSKPEPARAARYQKMFGNTHSFLPKRNGVVPNTAHILLHLATAATLLVLFLGGI